MNDNINKSKIIGFILDIDGTLLSSKEAHLGAWRKALRHFGIFKNDDDILPHFGKPTSAITPLLTGSDDVSLNNELTELKTSLFIDEISKIPLYPGVSSTLKRIKEIGGKIIFASSNFNHVLEKIYLTHDWDEISEGYIGLNDITHGKPHPEMILKALDKIRVEKRQAVMIGDSIYDVQAGNSAGVHTIAVCTKHSKEEWLNFENAKPELILNNFKDLHDLLPLYL